MNKKLNIVLKYHNLLVLLVLVSLYLLGLFVFILSYKTPYFLFPVSFGFTEALSVFLFVFSLILGNRGLKWYVIFLVVNILAIPASIDNIIPSILISASNDNREIFFPLVTHIDLYLILGMVKYWKKDKVFYISRYYVVLSICVLLLTTSIYYNIFSIQKLHDTGLIIANSYHVRYILLFFLLFQNTDIKLFNKSIQLGLLISLIFLILEAIIYGKVFLDSYRIVSGNLGNNTFANFLSAVSCYYIYLLFRNKINRRYILLVMVMVVVVFFARTRSAYLILLTYFTIETVIYFRKLILLKQFKKTLVLLGIVLVSTTTIFVFFSQNDRLNWKNFKITQIDFSKKKLSDIIVLEENEFNASLNLRLDHYQTSLNMINKSPWLGIGPGRWNVYKASYGSKDENIMDSHNDILAMASQYGLLPGILFCLCLYLMPLLIHIKKIKNIKTINSIRYLFIINLGMILAGMTNSGMFKHHIFGILALIVVFNIFIDDGKRINKI